MVILVMCIPNFLGFYCQPTLQFYYMMLCSVLPMAVLCLSFAKFFRKPEYKCWRSLSFAALGVSVAIPVIHLTISLGVLTVFMERIIIGSLLYLAGAVLYALHIPERFFPGKFDVLVSVTEKIV